MFHLAAYYEAIDATADNDVLALTDDILSIQNSHFVLSRSMQLLGAYAGSATLSRCKLASPTLRQMASPYIRPINVSATPGSNTNLMLLDHQPFQVQAFEEIQFQATSGVAMGTEDFWGLIWLADSITPIPPGNIVPCRFTSSTAAVDSVWTTTTLSWTDTLPSGVYAMVMSEVQGAGAIAHRWIFSNQELRPGFASFTTLASRHPYAISKGQFGVMGRFRSNDLPRLQVLCNTTTSTWEGYAHLVRVGNLN